MKPTTLRKGIITTLRWLTYQDEGDFIESPYMKRDYLGFPKIHQNTLDSICTAVNVIMMMEHNKTRVYNSMGEIRRGHI